MTTYKTTSKNEDGFTLVELAIVMIIIGLLIGGILKGQALIENARVSASVSQLKGTDGAVSTFRDAYNAFPGDMLTPAVRVPNCAGDCAVVGDGNGRLNNLPSAAPVAGVEGGTFWAQLAAADILGGVISDSGGNIILGSSHPEFELAGGVRVGFSLTGALGTATGGVAGRAGHYLAVGDITGAVGAVPVLTPGQAFRLDTKIDDGAPNTGSVLAAGAGTCAAALTTSTYLTASDQALCDLYMRIQG
jgi:prepilin-type N-terminal cleavage/methylation domain-containing protein